MEKGSHQPFSVFKRKDSPFFFVQFWNETNGEYNSARSTKETNERNAKLVAFSWLKDFGGPPPITIKAKVGSRDALFGLLNKFLIAEGLISADTMLSADELVNHVSMTLFGESGQKENPLFSDFMLTFWDWESSPYIKDKLENGQRISKQYVKANKGFVVRYALPFFKSTRIKSVSTGMLEEFKASLPRRNKLGMKGLSPRSINAILGCIHTALEEATRLGIIVNNPARKIRKLALGTERRGILKPEEIKKVFSAHWKDTRCRIASLVAASHGLRAGEIGALCFDDLDIKNLIIMIRHSWERHERKLKSPKNGHTRIIYTNKVIMDELISLYRANPHGNTFIFWNTEKDNEPMNLDNFRDSLQEVLVSCGISLDEQRARKIDFHSWRHYANSAIRGQISDAVLQQAMGHSSTEMTDRYYHMTPEQGEEYRNSVSKNILPLLLSTKTI